MKTSRETQPSRTPSKRTMETKPAGKATRVLASTLGGIIGLAGVMHGLFEVAQGRGAPEASMFNAIGPEQRLWEGAGLHAFTVLPDVFVTGIAAILLGAATAIWALAFIDRPWGPRVMVLLSLGLFIAGGGFGPLVVGVYSGLVASRINKPLTWWRRHIPVRSRSILASLWPWVLVVYFALFVLSVTTAVFGWPLNLWFSVETSQAIMTNAVGQSLLLLMLLMTTSALSHDVGIIELGEQ